MAGRIRQDDIAAVRERTDIVKVVSQHLQLKKAGRDSMVGLCPFHQEKTGSFSVSPSKQVYYCFGCGEGGDVFKFVEKVENLPFAEAVERLAREAGVTVRYDGQTPAERRAQGRTQVLHKANAEAARLYHRTLLEGREGADAREYLQGRGLTPQSIERFEVGYAPGYSDFLMRRLSKTYSPELLVEAGLVADAGGTLKDRFRGRVTFPIHDLSGNAVAIGGRLLQRKDRPPIEAPKYLNSPESPVYRKGSILYNLDRAKPDVVRLERAILVEGYTDVIALDQAGVPGVVATCGTALGVEHLRALSKFANRLVLAFDSDEAGARAAERAFAFHQQFPVDLLVMILPAGQDPADFVLANGEGAGQAFEQLVAGAVPLVEYMIVRFFSGHELDDHEARARGIRTALERYVVPLEDEGRRGEHAAIVADRAGEKFDLVIEQLERMVRQQGGAADVAPGRPTLSRRSPQERVEREALKILVQSLPQRTRRLASLPDDRFTGAKARKALELLRTEPQDAEAAALVSAAEARSDALGRDVAGLAMEPIECGDRSLDEFAEAVFLRLEEFDLKRRADEVRKTLERINPEKHRAEHETLFEQLVKLEADRRRVREAAEAIGTDI